MSSIDPGLAAAQSLLLAVDAAIADATLNLGAAGDAISAQLQVGDLFPAIVLAPQGGTDLLEIFGQSVAAQLPPGIHPGQTILLQVNGFDGNRILVSNLGVADPQNPPDLAQVVVPPPAPNEPQIVATLTTIPQAGPRTLTTPPTAPPSAVFVAASVRPAPTMPLPPGDDPIFEIGIAPSPPGDDIEARMAATRTAPLGPPPSARLPTVPISTRIVPSVAPQVARAPQSVPLAALLTPRVRVPITARIAMPEQAHPVAVGDAVQKMLARIRVPQTSFALAAARIANDAVASIPRAFARLEAALPRELPAAALPLRALLSFVSKFDLSNTGVLPEQIAAFVSHVVDGAEAKLADALVAHREADAPSLPAPVGQDASTSADPRGRASATTDAMARAVERTAAFDFDLKSALAALAESPSSNSSPELSRAVADAIATATGVQFAALSNMATDPSAISIALPAFFHEGGRPAQLHIDRDAPGGRQQLDADNFRIGFVLDTGSLGTIAIDVETVGRIVRVDVRTERAHAADRIKGTLPDLRARFEQLRYRVAAMTAGILQPRPLPAETQPAPPPPEPPLPEPTRTRGLDLQA